jgi:hypothetical protein
MTTFWILLCLASVLTYFYFKQKWNVALAVVTSASWLAMMIFTLTTPPVDISVGSYLQEVLILIFTGAAIIMLIMWFRNRDRFIDENGKSELTEEQREERRLASKSPMQMSENEYKAYLRTRRRRAR